MREIKHPEVNVRLVGEDGNAYVILGRVTKAMRLRAGTVPTAPWATVGVRIHTAGAA